MKNRFPDKIFDGTHSGRENLSEIRPPDYQDYLKLSQELGAIQGFILQNLENLTAAPDTLSILASVEAKAKNIEEKLKNLATPDALDSYIRGVEVKLDKLLSKLVALQKSLAALHLANSSLDDRIGKIEKAWATDVTAFQRYNRGEFSRLKESIEHDIHELKTQIQTLRDIF